MDFFIQNLQKRSKIEKVNIIIEFYIFEIYLFIYLFSIYLSLTKFYFKLQLD